GRGGIGIEDLQQSQAMGWRGGPGEGAIPRLEHSGDPLRRLLSLTHFYQAADDVPDHVLEKGRALHRDLDLALRFGLARREAEFPNGMGSLAVGGPECRKVVLAEQGCAGRAHCRHVQWLKDLPVGITPQRRPNAPIPDLVAVAFSTGVAPGIKVVRN